LVVQQAAAELVLTERFDGVSLVEVNADERAMGALAQRLSCEREEPGLERLAVPPGAQMPRAERIERTQAELAKTLAFEQDPVVVVPVG